MTELGVLIREERLRQKLTQTDLAGISGVGITFISQLENGKESAEVGKALRVLTMLGIIIGIGSVDASGVQAICDATGGAYYSISSVGSMAELYNSIYRMEKELYLLEFTDSTGASVSDAASIQVGYAGADYAGSCTYSYTPNVLLSAESSTIFSDGPEATVERYLKNFDDAMTYTDFSRISDCLKPGSDIYAEQEAYVTRGISEELDSYEISPASYTDDAHATVATRETFYVQVPGKPLQLMTQECTYALERVGDTWLMTSFVDLEVTNRINQ